MDPGTASFRHAGPHELAQALEGARNYTLSLFDCFAAQGLDDPARVPRLAHVNPPLWEFGHIAWFAERFVLRDAGGEACGAGGNSLLRLGDQWFDSGRVGHELRWEPALPRPGAVKTYCREVLERVLDKLSRAQDDGPGLYPFRLVLAHEDMHGEALRNTLQTLGAMWPGADGSVAASEPPRELAFAGGTLLMGSECDSGFVFDNEKWSHPVVVPPFSADAQLVSNARFAEFVRDGGYRDPRHWSPAGLAWLGGAARGAPRYWHRDGSGWSALLHGRLGPLEADAPVRHVSLYEAQAYCAWSGRRLPGESEWECAATSGNPGFRWGQLWEWTASPFQPYPGFAADAYRDYSEPYFGTCQVLRGASFATPQRAVSARFRNYYLPGRDDVFCGFRTCAP